MNKYKTIHSTIYGLLSDDQLYFEGINRPAEIYFIKDGNPTYDNMDILERYFNDVYNLFLRKISIFATLNKSDIEETTKLQALLQELIKVKELLISSSESKDKSLL